MKAAGIDASLTATGVALGPDDPHCYVVGSEGITKMSLVRQDVAIGDLALRIIEPIIERGVGLVVIEGLDMAQSYGGQIERCVLWWQIVHLLHSHDVRVFVAPSPTVKIYATGTGLASKGQVIEAVTRQWPQFETRGDNNKADAVAMLALACAIGGEPMTEVTADQRRAAIGGAAREITEAPPEPKIKRKRA